MPKLPRPLREDATGKSLAADELKSLWYDLTDLQQEWLVEYLTNGFNATQAALDAGYKTDEEGARVIGYQNRHHRKIQLLIRHAVRDEITEEETIARLARTVRATMADFIDFEGEGPPSLSLEKARERGVLDQVKKVKRDTRQVGEHEEEPYIKQIELRNAVKASKTVLKALGAFDKDEEDGGDTYNTFVRKIENHLHKDGPKEESPWPRVEGEPNQTPNSADA